MVELEPDGRLRVGNHFAIELVHCHQGGGISVKLDEGIARRKISELVSHDLYLHHLILTERLEGVLK